jgi:hypothetical protein
MIYINICATPLIIFQNKIIPIIMPNICDQKVTKLCTKKKRPYFFLWGGGAKNSLLFVFNVTLHTSVN